MSKKRHDHRSASDMPARAKPAPNTQAQATQPPSRTQSPKPARPSSADPQLPWRPATRVLVSLLVAIHLLAVFVAPWNLSTRAALPPGYTPGTDSSGRPLPPPPPDEPPWQQPRLIRALAGIFRHYQNLAYLNHGYEFFAPDPAGTHLIRYRVSRPDGKVIEGHFPDLKSQWPRLFYHRHMMLAEQTAGMGEASGNHYAEHLARVHGGKAHLEWVVHLLLSPKQVRDGKELDAPDTYRVLATVDADASLLKLPPTEEHPPGPLPQGSAILQPYRANGGGR